MRWDDFFVPGIEPEGFDLLYIYIICRTRNLLTLIFIALSISIDISLQDILLTLIKEYSAKYLNLLDVFSSLNHT